MKISQGSKVVVDSFPHTTVYEVVSKASKFEVFLREAGRPHHTAWRMDVSFCKPPTPEQLKNHNATLTK